jgi:hypothetical protein
MKTIRFTAATLSLLTLLACGKRDDPHPPVPVVAKATSDLLVTQRGSDVILSWSYPSLTESGQKLPSFDRILVYRYVEKLPATAAPTAPSAAQATTLDPSKPPELQQFSVVPTMNADQFRKLRERIGTLPSEHVPEYVAGARIVFQDVPPPRDASGVPIRLTYAVVTEAGGSESPLSNLVSIVPLSVSTAARNLRATADATGIHLSWTPPEQGEKELAGYNIYRFGPAGEIVELGAPLNSAPLREPLYLDAPPVGGYRYLVTAVRHAGPPVIESEPTPTVYAEFKDLDPPPAPTGDVALAEESAVRVVWDTVEAADLAGYRVYRSEGGAKKLLNAGLLTESTYRDSTLKRGVTYIYSVSSVDKLGNESAATAAASIMIPNE